MTDEVKPTAVDQEPTKNVDEAPEQSGDEKKELTILTWPQYYKPANMQQLLTKRWKLTTGPIFLYYIIQFIMCVGACNFFSDTTRTNTCTLKDGSLLENEEASAVFDTSLRLVTIWHIAEWVRSTVMLCITMLGAPFLSIWYATGIVTSLFGLISFLLVHVGRFGEEGISCAESQSTRGQWMIWEVIFFWLFFGFFQFPMIVFRCCKKEKLSEIIEENDDEDEE